LSSDSWRLHSISSASLRPGQTGSPMPRTGSRPAVRRNSRQPSLDNARVEPTFFATPADFRSWLEAHHGNETELLVGYYKKATGRPSITWPESVDEALCFGWIDGVRRGIDEESYSIRFSPRQKRSIWSAVNIKRAGELIEEGRMTSAGLAAFAARTDDRSAIYSHERRHNAQLEPEQEARFRANARAWEWFQGRPPSYRRTALHWVVSAKRPETRERRLAALIEDSAAGRNVKPLTRPGS
jgi:uncharacterized protein YdeI (YjbR/CyaY-like superfamily)